MVTTTLPGTSAPVRMWVDPNTVEPAALQQLRNVANLPWTHGVAVMPDVHYGKGATVGSVIAMRQAVSPAAVGVDIGCFRGDTRVLLLNGTQVPIKTMAQEGGHYWVYSINEARQVAPGKAVALKTRGDAPLVKVTVSGGDEIVCTPDHLFMMSDGSYREARDLRFNDSLMPLYRRWQTRDGYESVSNGKGYSKLTHISVFEDLNGKIPAGHVVHHKDQVHFNNDPSNLVLMSIEDHSRHHRTVGHSWNNSCPEFQRKRLAGIRRRREDPVSRQQMAEVGTANIQKYMRDNPEHFRESTAGNGRRGARYLARFNITPRECHVCGDTLANPAALGWHKKRAHQESNHKVICVDVLDETADVYCLQVEKYHNFALAAGVFVHNCGVTGVRLADITAADLPADLGPVRSAIEAAVPVGFRSHDTEVDPAKLRDPATGRGDVQSRGWAGFWQAFKDLTGVAAREDRAHIQMGTLGGGNHFIELCTDDQDGVWVTLHSGSRNVGKELAERHIAAAKELPHNQDLPDRDLAVFLAGTPEMAAYRRDLYWAQDYATRNRDVMLALIKGALRRTLGPVRFDSPLSCHHNYVSEETYDGVDLLVTRKGAISTADDRLGIIPGSMGTGSFVVRGLGNPAAFCSASHGAGRRMSRGAAKRAFTVDDLAEQTMGVECRKDAGVLDEIPGAYKDIESVMEQQADLVAVLYRLRTVLCVKG